MFALSCIMQAKLRTPVSGLLISWATPAARRPTEASFSLRPSWRLVTRLSRSSRSARASAMPSTAWQSTPISPGGRMPTRAARLPAITRFDMATMAPMGRSTAAVTKKISTRLAPAAVPTIASSTPMITRWRWTKGAWSRPTASTPMTRPEGSRMGSEAVRYHSLMTRAGAIQVRPRSSTSSQTAALSRVPTAREPSLSVRLVEMRRSPWKIVTAPMSCPS